MLFCLKRTGISAIYYVYTFQHFPILVSKVVLNAAMLVRSKHFKILGSKVHLRKSSSLRRCHYDSSPSLRLLGSKGVLEAVCVHHGRLGGRRQMQAIARRATSPPPPPTVIKNMKIRASCGKSYFLPQSLRAINGFFGVFFPNGELHNCFSIFRTLWSSDHQPTWDDFG